MPRRRPSQCGSSRKLRLEVLERRDFLAADLLPLEAGTIDISTAQFSPEVLPPPLHSNHQEIALDGGKRLIFKGDHEGLLIHPDGAEERLVGIEVIRDPNLIHMANGIASSTLMGWSEPVGKQRIGRYSEVVRETPQSRNTWRYYVYGLPPGEETPQPPELDVPPEMNTPGLRHGSYLPGLPVEAPRDLDPTAPSRELPTLPISPPVLIPADKGPLPQHSINDPLVYHESAEGAKLARFSEVPPGVFFWYADPPAPRPTPTPAEIEQAVVNFQSRDGSVVSTTIAQGPPPGAWNFYWVEDARVRLPAGWFDGADITWEVQVIESALAPPLPPA